MNVMIFRELLAYLLMSHIRFFEKLNGGDRAAAEFGSWRVVIYSCALISVSIISPLIFWTLSIFGVLKEMSSVVITGLVLGGPFILTIIFTGPILKDYDGFIAECEQFGVNGSRRGLMLFPFALFCFLSVGSLLIYLYGI